MAQFLCTLVDAARCDGLDCYPRRRSVPAGRGVRRLRMKARRLIDGASFGPDALKVVGQALDEAWAQIAGNFGNDPSEIERARLRLANAMLSVASEDSRDTAVLVRSALDAMRIPRSPRRAALKLK